MMWKFQLIIGLALIIRAHGEDDPICFAKGECRNGLLIAESITLGENSCLNFCRKVKDCSWFTYNSKNNFCMALSTCSEVSAEGCLDCLSGQVECPNIDNACWVKGLCRGTVIHQVDANSSEECQGLCHSYDGCGWFSYDPLPSVCLLFKDCPTLDESCETCVSSSALCKAKTSYTKLFVASGDTDGESNEVEIIDLESSASVCSNLTNYPEVLFGTFGGLDFNDNPLICGGWYVQECFSWSGSEWQVSSPLNEKRGYASSCSSPFPKESHKMLVAGGSNQFIGSVNTVEIMTKNGWEFLLPSLPGKSLYSCMVLLNSTTAFLIGGIVGGESGTSSQYSPKTFLFNTEANRQEWIEGPTLKFGREFHSCARIRKDSSSHQFSVIVVGGWGKGVTPPVEVLDEGTSEWRNGPDLPFKIKSASLVEDPTGGVILVGGASDETRHLKTLFRLSDAGDESKWIEMPQKLKFGRSRHASFLVPDNVASCSLK